MKEFVGQGERADLKRGVANVQNCFHRTILWHFMLFCSCFFFSPFRPVRYFKGAKLLLNAPCVILERSKDIPFDNGLERHSREIEEILLEMQELLLETTIRT